MKEAKPVPAPALDPKFKPVAGDPIPWDAEDVSKRAQPAEWASYQKGNADGIIYLGEVSSWVAHPDALIKQVHEPSLLRLAIPFLRPVQEKWKQRHSGKTGYAFPAYWRAIVYQYDELNKQIDRIARERDQPVNCLLLADRQAAIECNQPEYRFNWVIVPTNVEGVWAVFYKFPLT